jgi:hypothetical protein
MVFYRLSLATDWKPCVERFVQEWRRPESVASPRPSSVFARDDDPNPSKKRIIDTYNTQK